MSTTAFLPQNIEIDGVVHIQHWRSRDLIIYQGYTPVIEHDADELAVHSGRHVGRNQFHLFGIIRDPGEQLGEKIGTYSDLQAAMTAAEKEGRFA